MSIWTENRHPRTLDGKFTEVYGSAPEQGLELSEPSEKFGFDWAFNGVFGVAERLSDSPITAASGHQQALLVSYEDGTNRMLVEQDEFPYFIEDSISANAYRVPAAVVEQETGVDAFAVTVLREQMGERSNAAISAIIAGSGAQSRIADQVASDDHFAEEFLGAPVTHDHGVVFWSADDRVAR